MDEISVVNELEAGNFNATLRDEGPSLVTKSLSLHDIHQDCCNCGPSRGSHAIALEETRGFIGRVAAITTFGSTKGCLDVVFESLDGFDDCLGCDLRSALTNHADIDHNVGNAIIASFGINGHDNGSAASGANAIVGQVLIQTCLHSSQQFQLSKVSNVPKFFASFI